MWEIQEFISHTEMPKVVPENRVYGQKAFWTHGSSILFQEVILKALKLRTNHLMAK